MIKAAIIAMLLLGLRIDSPAQPFLSVTSSTDGAGNFTYTFDMANPSYVWGVKTNDAIYLPSYGVLNVVTPAGWSYSFDFANYIHLQYDSQQPAFLGQPSVTFTVQSSSTSSTLYDGAFGDPYGRGMVLGEVYTQPDHTYLAGGYETFSLIGPQNVPEPVAPLLGALCGCCMVLRNACTRRARSC